MGLRLEDDFGADFQHQSSYIAPNSFVTVGPGSGAVFGGPIVKPQMTNLLVNTENFSGPGWVSDGVSIMGNTVEGPSGRLASTIVWQSASGNVYQDALQTILASGYVYTFSVWLKGLNNGDVAHIGLGGNLLWKSDPIILTTNWQRVEMFAIYEKGPSGSVLRSRIYPPASGIVYAWGAQVEFSPFATDYLAATGATHQTRSIQVETDCIYIPRQTSNYYKNNFPPTASSWSAYAGGIAGNSATSPTGRSTSLFSANSANSNHVVFTENTPASSVVSKISGIYKPLNTMGIYTFATQGLTNGFLYTNISDRRTFTAGSQNSTGFVQDVGDGWTLVEHFSQNERAGGSRNEFGITSYGRNGFSGTTLSTNLEGVLIAGLWNSRTLGTTPITANAGASGLVLEDLLTAPLGSYRAQEGTFIFDAYIDWGIGVGPDAGVRTLFDASSTASDANRILLYKDLTANKYNLEVRGATGQISSGTVTQQLSIGWHRFAVTYSSGACSLWIDGTQRISTSGTSLSEIGTVRIGGNKFVASDGWGSWIKNFYSFRTALSSGDIVTYTSLSRTQFNSYRTQQTVTRRYQMWMDPSMNLFNMFGESIWGGAQSGATATVTSGAIDPFGGTLAYRVQAGNAPATRFKWQHGGISTTTINGVVTSFVGPRSTQYLNYYVPTTRQYTFKVWARANSLTPQPRVEANHPNGASNNILTDWSLITYINMTAPSSAGSIVTPAITVPAANQATGTIDVELFNPMMDVDVNILTETISPKSDDIPMSSGIIYKLTCAGNLNHGHSGTYESNYLDMGRNTTGTPYLGVDIVSQIPSGSQIVFEYFASDDNTESADGKWKSSIEQISGRFFKVKVHMNAESVETTTPEVTSVKPRPRYA